MSRLSQGETVNLSQRCKKKMLELNKKKHSGKLAPSEVEHLECEIAATDAETGKLV